MPPGTANAPRRFAPVRRRRWWWLLALAALGFSVAMIVSARGNDEMFQRPIRVLLLLWIAPPFVIGG